MLADMVEQKTMTADELLKKAPEERRGELVKGEFIKMSPAGFQHGRIAMRIGTFLNIYVLEHKSGEVCAAETGFLLAHDPDTVRAPDVAFVTTDRAVQQISEKGFFNGAPDLAVEVVSPSETIEAMEAKLIDYLESGTKIVWLVYPRTQTIMVYRSLIDVRVFTIADTLDGGELLPGFSVPIKEIFS